jgi:hypothetical protein
MRMIMGRPGTTQGVPDGEYTSVTLPLALHAMPTKPAQLGRDAHDAAVSFASVAYGFQERRAAPAHDGHAAPSA